MRREAFVVVLLLVTAVNARAQDTFLRWVDSLIETRYQRAPYDTLYLSRPTERLTLRMRYNVSGAGLLAKGMMGGSPFQMQMYADFKSTVSIGATYRLFSINLTLNPAVLKGLNRDLEFNVNSYGNKMGYDIVYQSAKTMRGWIKYDEQARVTIPKGVSSQQTLNVNAYYAFNHRRFSYPAAFTQSYLQRRSSGSVLVGVSFQGVYVEATANEQVGNPKVALQSANLGIGAGYGYNYRTGRRWLFHISAIPTLIVYNRNRFWVNDERRSLKYQFPEVIITGRGAIVYRFKRYFTGVSMVANFSTIGSEDNLQTQHTKWRLRSFIGVRI